MPRLGARPRPSKYQPLLDYLIPQDDVLLLSLELIEDILGFVLPDAAYSTHSFWANAPSILVQVLKDAGWHAALRSREQAVEFTRTTVLPNV